MLGNNPKDNTSKRRRAAFVAGSVTLLLIAASLNIRASHNWGDDFAQYILQARNVVTHQSQFDTGVIQNEWSALHVIPAAAPIGWPLLLAPVYQASGNNIFHFGQLVGIFTFLFGLVILWYFLQFWRRGTALFLTVLIVFNPWLITFKSSILTDIPFAVFVLGALSLLVSTEKQSWNRTVLVGLLIGYAISIRPAGIAVIGALGLYWLYQVIRKEVRVRTVFVHGCSIVLITFVLSFLLNSVVFKTGIGSSYYGFWSKRISQADQTSIVTSRITSTTTTAASRYGSLFIGDIQVIASIIPQTSVSLVNIFLEVFFLLAMAIGFIIRLFKPRVIEAFFVVYLAMLVIVQTRPEAGFRYFLPLTPFIFEYVFICLRGAGHGIGAARRAILPQRALSASSD